MPIDTLISKKMYIIYENIELQSSKLNLVVWQWQTKSR